MRRLLLSVIGLALVVADVQPGFYRVSLSSGGARIRAPEWVELTAGGTASMVVACRAPQVTIRLVDRDGAPAAGRMLKLTTDDDSGSAWATTDGDGRADLAVCPPGRLAVTAFPPNWKQERLQIPSQQRKDHEIHLEPIVVDATAGEQAFERVLPVR